MYISHILQTKKKKKYINKKKIKDLESIIRVIDKPHKTIYKSGL